MPTVAAKRRIVNVTSVGVHTGGYEVSSAPDEASKAAVANLTRTLARHGAPAVLVNSVAPGAVRTRMMLEESPPAVLAELEGDIPLGRMAEPAEIAALVGFLASAQNTYASGAAFDLNGGLAMA